MPKVFLSYAREDRQLAERLREGLRKNGIEPFDDAMIAPGSNISLAIEEGIESSDAVLVLVSKNSARSEWAKIEVAAAMASMTAGRPKRIVPVLVGADTDPSSDLPSLLHRYQWVDLRQGLEADSLSTIVSAIASSPALPGLEKQLDAEQSLLVLGQRQLRQERQEYERTRIQRADRRQRGYTTLPVLFGMVGAAILVAVALWAVTATDGRHPAILAATLGLLIGSVGTLGLGRIRKMQSGGRRHGRSD